MTTILNPEKNIGKAITRGAFPKQARSLYIPLPFDTDTMLQGQLPLQSGNINVAGLDMVQSIFIDNSDNSEEVTITFDNGYEVSCPPYAQSILPVLISGDTGVNFTAVSLGGVLVKMWFTNTREQPAVWVAGYPIEGTINVTGSAIFSTPTKGSFTDASGTLAVGATSQQLVAADGNRIAIVISNPATAASQGIAAPEPLYINFGAAATIGGSSLELLPGEKVTAETLGLSPTQAINWIATTVAHQIVCKVA